MILLLVELYVLIGITIYFISIHSRWKLYLAFIGMCLFIIWWIVPTKLNHLYGDTFNIMSNRSQLYHSFQHGDIIFTTEHGLWNIYDIMAINKGLVHTGIIIEEEGIKFMLHAYSGKTYSNQYVLYEYPYIGQTWKIIKEPLLHYMMQYKKSFYQIMRPPSHLPRIQLDMETLSSCTKYCSELAGLILKKHDIIGPSEYKHFHYPPIEILQKLVQNGYRAIFIRHG